MLNQFYSSTIFFAAFVHKIIIFLNSAALSVPAKTFYKIGAE